MPRFKENVTSSQGKKLHYLTSKEKWLTINQALGSDVILMLLTAVRRLIKYSIIDNNGFNMVFLTELSP